MTKEQIAALPPGTRLHWTWMGTPGCRGTFVRPLGWIKGFVVVQDNPGAAAVEVPDDEKTKVRVLGTIEALAEAAEDPEFRQPPNWRDYGAAYR